MSMLSGYQHQPYFCELYGAGETPLAPAKKFVGQLQAVRQEDLSDRAERAHRSFFTQGVTFTLYSGDKSTDRVLPFDVIPRIISREEWQRLEKGCKQRVSALNLFLHDIYHDKKILNDGIVPRELVVGNSYYRPEMEGFNPVHSTYVHICGIDLIRDGQGMLRVLEDNARCPSGVSYVLQNRNMMLRAFPDLMQGMHVRSVTEYGIELRRALAAVAPASASSDPTIVILSPGAFNSAYFEHVFLAQEMGVTLVEGSDLVVENDSVYMRTTRGLAKVDVIYRRLDDDFIDPEVFKPDSLLGVRGLVRAYRAGNVTLANAIGTGVADDKAVYAYMPKIIKYYLGEDAILPNVETYICAEPDALQYTLDHLAELVVKPVGASGGYGLLIGPKASKAELDEYRTKLKENPAEYISQPVMALSVCPTLVDGAIVPRHVDLRPFIVTGKESWVLPGGLTRVALQRGSLVVNSSQGGGSKDTWVMEDAV